MTGIDNWEYARWVYAVGRSLRYNPATGAELTAANTFKTNMLTSRTWLQEPLTRNSQNNGTLNNVELIGEQISIIGRDLMKIPVQDACEKGYCDTLFTATGNRKYGNMSNMVAANVFQP